MFDTTDWFTEGNIFSEIFRALGLQILVIIVAIAMKWQYDRNRYRVPKGPGSLQNLIDIFNFHRDKGNKLVELAREYPDCCTVLTPKGRFVLLNNLETIKELFVEKSDIVSHKIDGEFENKFRFKPGKHCRTGIFFRHFDETEKFLHKCLVKHVEENWNGNNFDVLVEEELKKIDLTEKFDVEQKMFSFSVRLMLKLCTGENLTSIDEINLKNFEENLYEIGKFLDDDGLGKIAKKFWMKIGGSSKIIDLNEKVFQFAKVLIENHRSTSGFIATILKNRSSGPEELDETELSAILLDLILHGSSTLKNCLSWIFLYALHFPGEVELCRREIRDENFRVFVFSQCEKLVRCRSFVKETLRLAPVVPLVFHSALEDFRWKNFHFQKRTLFAANLVALQRDAAWKNPDEFEPSRWFDENRNSLPLENFAPFSFGPRICVAQNKIVDFLTGIFGHFLLHNDLVKTGPIPRTNEGIFNLANKPPKFFLKANRLRQEL